MKQTLSRCIDRNLRGAVVVTGLCLGLGMAAFQAGCTGPGSQASALRTVAPVLEKASAYQFGADRAVLTEAQAYLASSASANRAMVEAELLALAERSLPDGGRDFVLRGLGQVGSAASVPKLASLLRDQRWYSLALNSLMLIPGPEAEAALLQALANADGKPRQALISTVGRRRLAAAIPSLVLLARSGEDQAASSSLNALGHIGTADALKALLSLQTTQNLAEDRVRAALAAASSLAMGRGLPAELQASTLALCRSTQGSSFPDTLRVSAFRTMIMVEGTLSAGELVSALNDKSEFFASAAAGLLAQAELPALVGLLESSWSSLPTKVRAVLVDRFAQVGNPGARSLALASLSGDDVLLRLASLRALALVGASEDVERLLAIALAEGETAAEAATSLSRLRDPAISSLIRSRLNKGDAKVDSVILRIASSRADREVFSYACSIIEQNSAAGSELRQAALEAVGGLAEPADLPRLLGILTSLRETPDVRVLDKALPGIVLNHASVSEAASVLVAAMSNAQVAPKRALRNALAVLEAPEAFAAFQSMVSSGSPEDRRDAIRAMGASRQFGHAGLLMEIATKSPLASDKVLAARSLMLLASQSYSADYEKRVQTFVDLWPHLEREDERKTLLKELSRLRPSIAKQLRPE